MPVHLTCDGSGHDTHITAVKLVQLLVRDASLALLEKGPVLTTVSSTRGGVMFLNSRLHVNDHGRGETAVRSVSCVLKEKTHTS